MRVTYVSHACLRIETGASVLVTDPWFEGPAFCGQWNVFPRPVDTAALEEATTFLVSHPHEDHLHEPTLRRLYRGQRVYYPHYWYAETIDWLRSFLSDVFEARSGRTYRLADGTRITFVATPGQNSLIVVEAEGRVFMNVNDALHSEPGFLIDLYVRQLKKRWPKIDAVFCGFGGASYYPNTMHSAGKNDHEMARLREQLFVHNFCRIVHGLQPRVAVPFAADFVLLAPHQRWINEVRFRRENIPAYYAAHFGGPTEIAVMYPGDRLVDGRVEASSPYRAQLIGGRLDHLVDLQYPEEISAFRAQPRAADAGPWAARLADHLGSQVKFHGAAALTGLRFSLRLRDLPVSQWFDVTCTGASFDVVRAATPGEGGVARIETTTTVFEASIDNDWGGDAFTIGYGCDVTLLDPKSSSRARLCVDLLTRYPRPAAYALKQPMRTLECVYRSAPMYVSRVAQRLRAQLRRAREANVITSPVWLSGDVDAIRRTCGLPVFQEPSVARPHAARVAGESVPA